MELQKVIEAVNGIPYMDPTRGRRVYEHLVDNNLRDVLELGTYHGVSTCYMAAAADEIGGSVITLDRLGAAKLKPNVNELAERLGLSDVVEAKYAERSFTWELRRLLTSSPRPMFDFVYLDGGHTWDVTGFAFFLVDLMLRPGGWLLFDDLEWSIDRSPALGKQDWVKELSDEERTAKQVRDVFDVLVQGDPRYTTEVDGNWGWAQKAADAG